MPLAPLDINVANVAKPAGAAKVKPASVPLLSAADEALISAAVARVHLAEALSAPPPPPTLPAIGGALTCTRMLGEGGFGQVWQGTLSRPTTDVVVAVKIVSIGDKDKEARQRPMKSRASAPRTICCFEVVHILPVMG